MFRLIAIIALLLLLAQPLLADCRHFSTDDRGFPTGILPSVSNFSINVERGTRTVQEFELTIVGDQSQGLRFFCSVQLQTTDPGEGFFIEVQPTNFSTGGGFNKTNVTISVAASNSANNSKINLTIFDSAREGTRAVIPLYLNAFDPAPLNQSNSSNQTPSPTQIIPPNLPPATVEIQEPPKKGPVLDELLANEDFKNSSIVLLTILMAVWLFAVFSGLQRK